MKFYNQFQKVFDQVKLLIHHDFTRITYVNVDVFKQRNFDVVIYHLKFDANFNNFKTKKIKFIMFFNRMLTSIEKRYWFIELKIIKLIWIIQRARYFIKTFKYVIVIFTNHAINAFITKQITLSFNNIDKLNFRLIKVSIYLFQFRFDIRY